MPQDKFSAVWVSHSSICDFLKCPRLYYLKNVYKDPETRHKISIMSPPLALGQSVHEIIESLSVIKTQDRFKESLISKFDRAWKKVSGKKGGFSSDEQEQKYKQRGEAMLRRVMDHPGPLKNLAVKINMDLPHYWLSEEEGIILCGKVDWLEYHPDTDEVTIIDFKTGKGEEDIDSLQLPIYHLLVANTQKRRAKKACYWYLDRDDEVCEQKLPDLEESHQKVLEIAKKMKLARKLEIFKCPQETGCYACKPFEAVLRGEGELIGVNEYNVDVYILNSAQAGGEDSIIL
ncbi:MAG TPA: PD-(D/E)XK nuclease family protein [Vitreimonas sp.]|nr:PD-(D/E)XK nuclease family protein [Vitreimonas sp.]